MTKEISRIIEEGGGQLLFDVAEFFKANGWNCEVSPYYIDMWSEKSRELDIIASKKFSINRTMWNNHGEFLIRLFIECKFIKNETLFYFVERNKKNAVIFLRDNNLLAGDEDVNFGKSHYTKNEEVAKNWSSKGRDDVYDAWNQCLHAMIYFREKKKEDVDYVIDFPIVVLKNFDNLYKKENNGVEFSKIVNNFQLEVNYTYSSSEKKSDSKVFFIDIINFENIRAFLDDLSGDISIFETRLMEILFNQARQDDFQKQREDQSFF